MTECCMPLVLKSFFKFGLWHLKYRKRHSITKCTQIAWPFTILQNHNITISWDFLRLTAPSAMPGHLGAVSLKKSLWYCNIIILWYSKGSGYMCRTYDGFSLNYLGGPGQYQTSNNLTSWNDTMAGYCANLFGIFMYNIFCCELVIHIAVGCLFHFFKYLLTIHGVLPPFSFTVGNR